MNKKQENKTVIKFSFWGSQSETALLYPLIDEFEKENPDIKIEKMHIAQNYFSKLHLLFASKLAPDVVFLNNYYAPKYIKAGLLVDLSPYIDKNKYFDKSLTGFTSKGKIYAIPRDVSDMVIYYNKDLFDRYNVKYPKSGWTLDDYLATAKAFKNAGVWGCSFETDLFYWLPFLLSNNASVMNKNGEIVINSPKAIDSIQFYADLPNKYHVAPQKSDIGSLTLAQLFLQQKLAMQISGRWLVPKYRKDANFNWDIVSFPKGTKGSVVNIDSSGYALSSSCKNKKAAMKFINFISSEKSLKKLTQSGLIVPARKDVAYSSVFLDQSKKPLNSIAFVETVQHGEATNVNSNYQQIADILNIALEPVFLGREKASQVIDAKLLIDLSRYAY